MKVYWYSECCKAAGHAPSVEALEAHERGDGSHGSDIQEWEGTPSQAFDCAAAYDGGGTLYDWGVARTLHEAIACSPESTYTEAETARTLLRTRLDD